MLNNFKSVQDNERVNESYLAHGRDSCHVATRGARWCVPDCTCPSSKLRQTNYDGGGIKEIRVTMGVRTGEYTSEVTVSFESRSLVRVIKKPLYTVADLEVF